MNKPPNIIRYEIEVDLSEPTEQKAFLLMGLNAFLIPLQQTDFTKVRVVGVMPKEYFENMTDCKKTVLPKNEEPKPMQEINAQTDMKLEKEMQELQQKIEKKEVMLVDDDHYTNSELSFEIEEHTGNLCLTFAPQYGSSNIMYLDTERVENLIEILKYYLDKINKPEMTE